MIHHDAAPIATKHGHGTHHRAQSASAVTSTAAHLSRVDEHIVPSSRSLKASKEQQSVSASAHRRESMADVSKRLAGLSSLQYSTEAVLDSLHHKLEAKLRLRDSHHEGHSPHKTSQQHIPVPRATPATPASAASKNSPAYHLEEAEDALAHTMVLELDLEDADRDEEAEEALNMPNTAEMRRAMLTASFRSSREEDADAPEMGAETEEDFDFHDAHDSFDEVYDNDDDFGDEEEQLFESNHESYESLDDVAVNGGYEQQYLHQKQAFSAPLNDTFDDSYDHEEEVPVVSAQRRNAPPAAQLHRKQPQDMHSNEDYERPDTIYPDEEAEPVRSYSYDDASGYNSDNSNVDETRGAVYNDSTMSSEYSVNVQEFLSPDARHSPRRAAPLSAQAHHRHHHDDVHEGEDDELIVMEQTPSLRSFDEYGSPGSARQNVAKTHGLFHVRSREDLLQSSSSVSPAADVRVRNPRKNRTSPSRSLFETSVHDEAPIREQSGPFTPPKRVAAEPRGEGSAQRRTPTGVSPSPRREQIRRVVLELDELDL